MVRTIQIDLIPNQSVLLQFKEEEKDEHLESLLSQPNTQDSTSSKQHYQNDEALIVEYFKGAVIEKKDQEFHTRIRLTQKEISTK